MTDPFTALRTSLAERYRLEQELGRGGMATVWLAEDVRHRRRVAVKVLHPELAAVLGAERFLAEIRTTANLQHPNILPLFDSGEASGQLYYVMPFVEGETLRARLAREVQLPVDDAIRIAAEVAGALDYAHRHGVIHRDIKPENILLHDGRALVADFGIALAVSHAGGERMTQTGLSLGTPQYMAPEQATGEKSIDTRADVYALGVVLYEMLAGQPPFVAPTLQGVIARVLTEEPRPLAQLRRSVPVRVDAAVGRALEKLPADRFSTAREFAAALEGRAEPEGTRGTGVAGHDAAASRSAELWRLVPWVVAAAALVAAAVPWLRGVDAPAGPLVRFPITIPPPQRLLAPRAGNQRSGLEIANDGSRLVLALIGNDGRTRLYIRTLADTTLTPVAGTEGAEQPFFSPDGTWIGFVQGGKLRKTPIAGGQSTVISDVSGGVAGASWGPGDVIVYGQLFGPLMRVPAAGGAPQLVAGIDSSGATFYGSQVLPDGETVLTTLGIAQSRARMVAVSLRTGEATTITEGGAKPRYVRGTDRGADRLVWVGPDGSVMSAPFDLEHRRLTGPAVAIAEGAQTAGGSWLANFACSLDGAMAFQHEVTAERELVLRDPGGTDQVLAAGRHSFRTPRFSPDGREVAAAITLGNNDIRSDVWTFDLRQRTLSRLTLDGGSTFPEYSPDGRWILYSSLARATDREILRVRAGGGVAPETLLVAPGQQHEGLLSPDGRTLVYREIGTRTVRDIWITTLGNTGQRRALAATDADEYGIAQTTDGRFIAFSSTASGRLEVYVSPVANPQERWQVSAGGGAEARWSRDGRVLYYRNADSLFRVGVETTPTFRVGARTLVFRGDYVTDFRANYDVSPDGRRFVLVRAVESSRPDQVSVLLNALPRH